MAKPYSFGRQIYREEKIMSIVELAKSELSDVVKGNGLPPRYYSSPEIFKVEMREVFAKTWQFAVHESEVQEPGSYALARIGEFEIIVARSPSGELHAMRNVCIHRGAKLIDCSGRGAVLRCPYHSWTYGLDGKLRAAPGFEEDPRVTPGRSKLIPVHFDRFGPLILVNLDDSPGELSDVIRPISDAAPAWNGLSHHGTRKYSYDCNWKIAIENSLECYHCPVLHPGFSSLIDTQNYVCEIYKFCATAGGNRRQSVKPKDGQIYSSATEHGASDVQTYFIWPNLWLLNYPGPANLVVARWFPQGLDHSFCLRGFYFGDDFPQEKRAEFVEYVETIQKQDLQICADVYQNIKVGAFERGFLRFGGGGLTEELILQFQRWLVAALERGRSAAMNA
jgi:choline monooxygenase